MNTLSSVRPEAILFDIDGTAVRHDQKEPTPGVRAAVRQLLVPHMPASGRSWPLVERLVQPLNLTTYCLLDGGASIVRAPGGEHVWSSWLTPELATRIARGIGRFSVELSCEAVYRRFDPRTTDLDAYAVTEPSPSIFGTHRISQEPLIDNFLASTDGISYRFMDFKTSTELRCVQVTATGVDKESGACRMLELSGHSEVPVLAIGDDLRGDEPLFRGVGAHGIKVAMGNAPDALKDLANWVAPTVEEDGFVVAMKHYQLLR